MIRGAVIFIAVAVLAAAAAAAVVPPEDPEISRVLSRVQALSASGTPAEWEDVSAELERISKTLQADGRYAEEVRVRLVQAQVLASRLNRPREAVAVLEELLERLRGRREPDLRPVYVALARYLARCGDRARIRELIEEFRRSPQYDGEYYPYRGGWGREVPLEVVRPRPGGSDSLTVTAMEKYLKESAAGVGALCPEFEVTDLAGRRHTAGEYRGRVLLIEFWQPGWAGWREHFARLVRVHRRYRGRGLAILSICYARSPGSELDYLRSIGVDWPLVYGGGDLGTRFGLHGEWGNAVVNRLGVITARDVRGGELTRAIREALGLR